MKTEKGVHVARWREPNRGIWNGFSNTMRMLQFHRGKLTLPAWRLIGVASERLSPRRQEQRKRGRGIGILTRVG